MARKQKTAAQKAKAKVTIKKRVEESRRETVETIIQLMERGGLDWVKEWSMDGFTTADAFQPNNPITGTYYRGMNRAGLAAHIIRRGVNDNRFCTAYQAQKMGWKVRDDAKPYVVEKWKQCRWKTEDDDGNEEFHCKPVLMSFFYVFSFADIDGAPEMPKASDNPTHEREEIDDLMDALKDSSRCLVTEKVSNRAFYSPMQDKVTVPLRDQFTSLQAALRTMLHEMGHSTMHPDACKRTEFGRFGSKNYAFEELIAELTAVFTASYLCVDLPKEDDDEHRRNHAAYLQSWLKALNDNPDYLYRAAAKAADASDYIIDRLTKAYPQYERTIETLEVPEEPKAA